MRSAVPCKIPLGSSRPSQVLHGAWGYGKTRHDALVELESVLAEWLDLKLAKRDDDIPEMEHINLSHAMG